MAKPTGFMEFERKNNKGSEPSERIKNFNEFHTPMQAEERQKQAARCMDCGVPFCQNGRPIMGMVSGCPLNNLIPEWNELVYTGEFDAAAHRLLMTNNFPEFTSRVCPALCEAACTCGLNGLPVSVKENENFIIENAFETGMIKPNPPKVRTGKRVAVIGSGPSGLACAAQLNMRGHSVTVYEKDDRLGGLLMYGIPNMKLEKHIIERRIELMKAEGVNFVTNANVGENYDANSILNDYDAVVLACGAGNPRDINVSGRDANGIYFAVDFLTSTTKSLLNSNLEDGNYISAKDKNVIIIGGGDTGNDCVGTSIRHGCKSVIQLEMMPKLLIAEQRITLGLNGLASVRQTTVNRRLLLYLAQTQDAIRQLLRNLSRTRAVISRVLLLLMFISSRTRMAEMLCRQLKAQSNILRQSLYLLQQAS